MAPAVGKQRRRGDDVDTAFKPSADADIDLTQEGSSADGRAEPHGPSATSTGDQRRIRAPGDQKELTAAPFMASPMQRAIGVLSASALLLLLACTACCAASYALCDRHYYASTVGTLCGALASVGAAAATIATGVYRPAVDKQHGRLRALHIAHWLLVATALVSLPVAADAMAAIHCEVWRTGLPPLKLYIQEHRGDGHRDDTRGFCGAMRTPTPCAGAPVDWQYAAGVHTWLMHSSTVVLATAAALLCVLAALALRHLITRAALSARQAMRPFKLPVYRRRYETMARRQRELYPSELKRSDRPDGEGSDEHERPPHTADDGHRLRCSEETQTEPTFSSTSDDRRHGARPQRHHAALRQHSDTVHRPPAASADYYESLDGGSEEKKRTYAALNTLTSTGTKEIPPAQGRHTQ